MAEERSEIERYGGDPARQAAYIQNLLEDHFSAYLKSKESGGQSFPDFTGALVMNELAQCVELSAAYRAKRQAEEAARQARACLLYTSDAADEYWFVYLWGGGGSG